ncbi:hypothetical protein T492DRAFT_1047962 [Pavlovales sp. CCMP2436]|nr:hypothetical protein T492DRAFT_1047962 [Pavlovales sp. CCMP2436]|mmetsp:Transcript_33072/g.77578  ORF Transcript_33072/g.77578 Transcript_33072/m.77578 type:complete len:158 (+) Transcript_33072:349-822(+)
MYETSHHRRLAPQDGRGAMWWAYEYRNPAALALFKHLSVSEEERDAVGLLPSDVYPDSAEELQELLADADERVAGIPAMLSQFVITLEQMRKEQAERFDEDLAPFEDADLDAGLDDEELDDELEEEEEEDSGPPAPEDIAARIAALKAKAQKMKDEM